jgi:hypothetical protein
LTTRSSSAAWLVVAQHTNAQTIADMARMGISFGKKELILGNDI